MEQNQSSSTHHAPDIIMNISHTYQSLISLITYLLLEMDGNIKTASRYIGLGHYNSAIGCLKDNRDLFRILETLKEALFKIHRRE